MQAKYARIFTDDRGISCFEDLTTDLLPGFAVPPAEPLHTAPFLAGNNTFWVGAPTDWRGGAPHPAPRRMIFVTVQGCYEVTTSENIVREFPVGSVMIVEDTTGAGHSTRIISADEVIVFAVNLPDAPPGGHALREGEKA